MSRAAIAAAAVVIGACVIRVPPPPATPPARSCVLFSVTADSVLVAAYAPPCDPNLRRPAGDTARTWRIPAESSCGVSDAAVDIERGEVRLRWNRCWPSTPGTRG